MMNDKLLILVGIVLLLLSFCIVAGVEQLKPTMQLNPALNLAKIPPPTSLQEAGRSSVYYLTSPISQTGMVTTGGKEQDTLFNGEIRFTATQGRNGELILSLDRLNLISDGVRTEKGDSGIIGLNLVKPGVPVSYDPKTGRSSAEFFSTLHYDLIDQTLGFIPSKSEEGDQFFSQTEEMAGTLKGKFPEQMKITDKNSVSFNGDVSFKLEKSTLGAISDIRCVLSMKDLIWTLTSPSDVIVVQPVFIGSGPSDPGRTGKVYDALIRNASEIWGRCGTVRCIAIQSNAPMYVNDPDYKVLNSEAEAGDLMAEVSMSNAVEVFIVDRWDPYYDGGGACWSSGTASSKIVTCDQQLNVPCPPPSGLWGCDTGSCGAVNFYHLGHELGHAIGLLHYGDSRPGMVAGTSGSIMDPSGFCWDNPAIQSAKNCRSASSPLFTSGRSICTGSPDIMD